MKRTYTQMDEGHGDGAKEMKIDHQYFGSGAGIYALSNFYEAPFSWNGFDWPSSEHAYQAAYRCSKEDWSRFAVGGDLSTLERGIPLVYKKEDVEKKCAFWGAKSTRHGMVGIVAKQAVKPVHAAKIGLHLLRSMDDERDLDEIKALFVDILLAKYRANPLARSLLLGTGTKVLVEFSRSAGRETKAGRPPLWTGLMVDGRVVGSNLQGELQMQVRSMLLEESEGGQAGE